MTTGALQFHLAAEDTVCPETGCASTEAYIWFFPNPLDSAGRELVTDQVEMQFRCAHSHIWTRLIPVEVVRS